MVSREVAYGLITRGEEVLMEQRPASVTVMPGMWELPSLKEPVIPEAEVRMTLRHAIMQVSYYVRIRSVAENEEALLSPTIGERRWVSLSEAEGMALTGLTRKILMRAHLLGNAVAEIASSEIREP